MTRTRPIHRQALALALACLLLAVVAVSAPAASQRDGGAQAQERYYSSYGEPAQDLRSPDAADPFVAPAPPAGGVHDAIAPLPFAIALAGAAIAGIGISTAVRARRRVAA